MATLIIVGSSETRVIARPGRAPLVYTPRAARECERMIEPGHRVLDRLDRRHLRQHRPAQHDHRQAERARRRDLAVGRRAAAVLRDDDLDPMLLEQRAIVGFRERPAAGDIARMRHGERRIDRIDAAHEIMVLRRAGERRELLAAEREKDAARRVLRARAAAAGISATSVQRSPATAIQGGRRSASSGTPVDSRGLAPHWRR